MYTSRDHVITHGNSTLGPALPPALTPLLTSVSIAVAVMVLMCLPIPDSPLLATMGTLQPLIWLSSVSETSICSGQSEAPIR